MASTRAPINPEMLAWARKRLNADPAFLAQRVGTSPAMYEKWEAGERRPTVKQVQKVAQQLRRPVAHFYLDSIPEEIEPRLDMRRVFGGSPHRDSFVFAREVQDCMSRRETALTLFEELSESPPSLPAPFAVTDDPEEVSERVRYNVLGLSDRSTLRWQGTYETLRGWRSALERAGTLSFQISGVELREARGFAMAERPLPVAAFNSKDSVRGRVFTLLHEFAHLLLGASTLHTETPFESDDATEWWCNHVAAALLIPKDDLLSLHQVHERRAPHLWSAGEVEALAQRYGASPSAMIRRLSRFDLITSENFAALSEDFDRRRSADAVQRERNAPSGGNFYDNQLVKLGSLLPTLAFRGFYAGALSVSGLSSVLGTKKIPNLGRFEEKVMGSRYAFEEA